jgi:hypothetical protein
MRTINIKATRIFEEIIKLNLSKIDNSNGCFIPLHVEMEDETEIAEFYSFAHYYEQNGDLMADPIMKFYRLKKTGQIFPFYYSLDGLGIYQTSIIFENYKPVRYCRKTQKDQAVFANQWLYNIKLQQSI